MVGDGGGDGDEEDSGQVTKVALKRSLRADARGLRSSGGGEAGEASRVARISLGMAKREMNFPFFL